MQSESPKAVEHEPVNEEGLILATLPPCAVRPLAEAVSGLLTPRERTVLLLLASGQSNKAIARVLGITEYTIKAHVSGILLALGCENRVQAALIGFCLVNGLHAEARTLIRRLSLKEDIAVEIEKTDRLERTDPAALR